jgi:hypothetical protein
MVRNKIISVKAEPPQVFVSYAWGDVSPSASKEDNQRQEVVERLCRKLEQERWSLIRDKGALDYGGQISVFMKTLGQARMVIVVLSEKYLRSPYCMTELYSVYQNARQERQEFLNRIIPLVLKDADIGNWRGRANYAEHWETEFKAMEQHLTRLGEEDLKLYRAMRRWHNEVGDMLAYVNDILAPHEFDEIVKDDFAALRQMLERHRAIPKKGAPFPRTKKDFLVEPPAGDIAAAIAGDTTAIFNLGSWYEHCKHQDYAKAREWYQKAADASYPAAMNNLGLLYEKGHGGPPEYNKAREWYQMAAQAGDTDAMFNLGTLYEEGIGLAPDHDQAREWYQKAADAGDQKAKQALAKLSQVKATNEDDEMRLPVSQGLARGRKKDPSTLSWLKERAVSDGDADVRQEVVQQIAGGWK